MPIESPCRHILRILVLAPLFCLSSTTFADVDEPVSDQEIKTFFRSGHPLKCAVGQAAQMQGDHETAVWIFSTCAKENNLYGIMSLAMFYELGLGVEKSDENAVALYRQAAHHPDHIGYGKNGMYYYALALLQGKGAPQDVAEGMRWMYEAARYGQRDALEYIDKLEAGERQSVH